MKNIFLLTLLIGQCITASATRIEYGNNVIISSPVYEDLYVAGGSITINAPIHGDLIIAGGTIIINDTITNDILMAGGTARFNGFAGDDIRCAGGDIRISKNVTGDLVVAGGSVIIDRGITIGGLLASGGDITIDGNINGDVKGAFGNFILNGTVTKDIDCRGGKITINGTIGGKSVLAARYITIGNNARFMNDIRYWNRQGSLNVQQSLKSGSVTYDPSLRIRTGQWYYLGATTIIGLLWYSGMALVMILLIQYLFGNTMKKAADTVFDATWKSLGIGFLFFIAVPVAAVIAFITVIGVPVGLFLLFSYIALILLATVITSVVAANWFNNRNTYNWNYWRQVMVAFGIFILLKLISATPVAGWLLILLSVCIAFGSIILSINWKRKPVETTLQ